ncbi:magnesium transporter [Baffinella frigidus]|nr:magnesium transporter [Cryptophyta sp. CCMP2293]|mmetsp:Transcript_521/g.1162  ORF Transcript_521/g.1162 Transcript_521/m.1162 type:complete len:309 (+) Transcript_521:148-1074(+)
MQSAFLGVLFGLLGNGLIGMSFSVMKVAHSQNNSGGSYLKIPLWWAGNALMALGELGNLCAYALARPALISPLGAVSVVINAPMAFFVLGERLSFRNMAGCVLCILGGYFIVSIAANNAEDRPPLTVKAFEGMLYRPPFLVFLAVSLFEAVDLIWSGRSTVMAYILICSLLGSITVLTIKALSSFVLLTLSGLNQFDQPLPYAIVPAMAVSMALQLLYLNKAIAEYGTGEVVPAYYVLFTTFAVLGSAILFSDLHDSNAHSLQVLVCAFVATSLGVYLVSHDKGAAERSAERAGDDRGVNESDMETLL